MAKMSCEECGLTNIKVYDNLNTLRCPGCDTLYLKREGKLVQHTPQCEEPIHTSTIRPTLDVPGRVDVPTGCMVCDSREWVEIEVIITSANLPYPTTTRKRFCQDHLNQYRGWMNGRQEVLGWKFRLDPAHTPADVVMLTGNMIDTLFSDGPTQLHNPDAGEYVDQGDQPKHNFYRKHPHQVMRERKG